MILTWSISGSRMRALIINRSRNYNYSIMTSFYHLKLGCKINLSLFNSYWFYLMVMMVYFWDLLESNSVSNEYICSATDKVSYLNYIAIGNLVVSKRSLTIRIQFLHSPNLNIIQVLSSLKLPGWKRSIVDKKTWLSACCHESLCL